MKKETKENIGVCLFLLFISSVIFLSGWQFGKFDGFEKGYEAGYGIGQTIGYSKAQHYGRLSAYVSCLNRDSPTPTFVINTADKYIDYDGKSMKCVSTKEIDSFSCYEVK